MTVRCTVEELDEALMTVRQMLEADGFVLHADIRDGAVALQLVPGPNACGDCLVSHDLLISMIVDHLRLLDHELDISDVVLSYTRR